ncbi:MAG: helix-turn-helix domain-containing protein [Lachnospiraceae bacterium]|nr:helix-turn-helix domain-containing protein [Lachnospiraceae bacterium]
MAQQKIIMDIPMGENIKKLRQEKGMRQTDVITQMQLHGSIMSRSTLANIETCRRNIKASDLTIMKEVFDTDYDSFFETKQEEK